MTLEALYEDLKAAFGEAVRLPEMQQERQPEAQAPPAEGQQPPAQPQQPQQKREPVINVDASRLREVCVFLKERGFSYLIGMTAVDFHERNAIELLYWPFSLGENVRLQVVCALPRDSPRAESLTSVWRAAELPEREVFDLFGVRFTGHPDLRRLFLDDDFEGHPLRKDWSAEFFLKKPEVGFR